MQTPTRRRATRATRTLAGLTAMVTALALLSATSAGARTNRNTYRVAATVPLGAAGNSVAIDEQLHRAYVTTSDQIKVIDTDKHRVIATINVPDPGSIVVDSQLHRGWVTPGLVSETAVYEINTKTNKFVNSIELGHALIGITNDPRTHRVYVGSDDPSAPEVSVLDGHTGRVLDSISVDGPVQTLEVDQWIHRLAVVPGGVNWIEILDSRTGERIRQADTALYTVPSTIDPNTHRAYFAAGPGDRTLITLDVNSGELTTSTPLGNAFGLAVDPDRGALYATDRGGEGLQILDLRTLTQRQELALGATADAVTVDHTAHRVYVTAGNNLVIVAQK